MQWKTSLRIPEEANMKMNAENRRQKTKKYNIDSTGEKTRERRKEDKEKEKQDPEMEAEKAKKKKRGIGLRREGELMETAFQ